MPCKLWVSTATVFEAKLLEDHSSFESLELTWLCADHAQGRTAIATFSMGGVQGTVTLTQPSPGAATAIAVKLANLASQLDGWHIHVLPVPSPDSSAGIGAVQCGAVGTGAHYDPYNTSTLCSTSTLGLACLLASCRMLPACLTTCSTSYGPHHVRSG